MISYKYMCPVQLCRMKTSTVAAMCTHMCGIHDRYGEHALGDRYSNIIVVYSSVIVYGMIAFGILWYLQYRAKKKRRGD